MAVIRPEIETDPEALEQIAIEYLQDALPGWEPAEGDLMTWLIAAHARMVAEERDIAADVPLEQILRPLGEEVHRIPPRVSSPATVRATVSLVDGQGYTVPAGAEVFVRTAGDDGVTMAVTEAVTLPPAPRDSTGAYIGTDFEVTVRLQAIEGREGTSGNGLGPGNEVVPIRALEFIKSIKLDGTSTGGTDAETDDEYLDRLVDTLALTSPVPILPEDFAAIARMQDGVERALAIDEPVLAQEILSIRSRNAELKIFDGSGLTMVIPAGADATAVRAAFAAYDPIVEGGPLGTADVTVRLRNRLAYGDWFVTVTPTTTDPAYGGLGVVQHGGYRASRERAIKLAVIGPEGAPVTTTAHQAVVDAIEAVRELNGFSGSRRCLSARCRVAGASPCSIVGLVSSWRPIIRWLRSAPDQSISCISIRPTRAGRSDRRPTAGRDYVLPGSPTPWPSIRARSSRALLGRSRLGEHARPSVADRYRECICRRSSVQSSDA